VERRTIFSGDRKYRYTLWRQWDFEYGEGTRGEISSSDCPFVMFIGLNPSTADETKDDPTIRRCIGFAKSWGFGALCMTNIFAWRETDSSKLPKINDPVGIQNNSELCRVAKDAGLVVAAWGTKGEFHTQPDFVKKMMHDIGISLHCIRKTQAGHPEHPLYLPKTLTPILL
jgi:hypothetical protein